MVRCRGKTQRVPRQKGKGEVDIGRQLSPQLRHPQCLCPPHWRKNQCRNSWGSRTKGSEESRTEESSRILDFKMLLLYIYQDQSMIWPQISISPELTGSFTPLACSSRNPEISQCQSNDCSSSRWYQRCFWTILFSVLGSSQQGHIPASWAAWMVLDFLSWLCFWNVSLVHSH